MAALLVPPPRTAYFRLARATEITEITEIEKDALPPVSVISVISHPPARGNTSQNPLASSSLHRSYGDAS